MLKRIAVQVTPKDHATAMKRRLKRAWDRNLNARERGKVKQELMHFVLSPPKSPEARRAVFERVVEILQP